MPHNADRAGDTLLFYDADCGFCAWAVARVLRLDRRRRLRPVALQSPVAARFLAEVPPGERMESWHLVAADGSVHSGGDVFAAVMERLPGGRLPSAAAASARRPLNSAYRWGADRRVLWGRAITAGARRRARERIEERSRALKPAEEREGELAG